MRIVRFSDKISKVNAWISPEVDVDSDGFNRFFADILFRISVSRLSPSPFLLLFLFHSAPFVPDLRPVVPQVPPDRPDRLRIHLRSRPIHGSTASGLPVRYASVPLRRLQDPVRVPWCCIWREPQLVKFEVAAELFHTCMACMTSDTLCSLNPEVRRVDCRLSRNESSWKAVISESESITDCTSLLPSPFIGYLLFGFPFPNAGPPNCPCPPYPVCDGPKPAEPTFMDDPLKAGVEENGALEEGPPGPDGPDPEDPLGPDPFPKSSLFISDEWCGSEATFSRTRAAAWRRA